jgi:stage IV sporulation protein FB
LGLIIAIIVATRGTVEPRFVGFLPYLDSKLGGELGQNPNLNHLVDLMLQINLYWPLINLLPVLPLDGGQIAMQVLVQQDPWAGTQRALWLSVIAGGAMALFALLIMHQTLTMMLFASLAVSSYVTLQQMGGGGRSPW